VFVREPRPGAVKTRLAARVGEGPAAALYRAMAEQVLRRTDPRQPPAAAYARRVVFTPAAARASVAAWLPGEALQAQEGQDLGARMAAAFSSAFAGGAERVALVGTDVPALSRAEVEGAFERLERADVVMGPAHDGGYYLLALARPQPELFRGVPWGSDAVASATERRAEALGLSLARLPVLHDVDTADDLRAAWPVLRPLLAPDVALLRALEAALAPGAG
jgi:rSAM/selenodomain-associated transferase 1